jgi:hypothetical protein
MVFSPEENFRDLSGFEIQKHQEGKKVSEKFAANPSGRIGRGATTVKQR